MSPVTVVAFVGLLAGILALVVAALVWQEARSRRVDEGPVYVLSDAVRFVHDRLEPEVRDQLRRSGVQRILEWELHYLQGLAQPQRWRPVETVAGGADPAVEWISHQIQTVHGVTYPRDHIRRVLRAEADYLASIGAVGEPVAGEPATEQSDGGDQE